PRKYSFSTAACRNGKPKGEPSKLARCSARRASSTRASTTSSSPLSPRCARPWRAGRRNLSDFSPAEVIDAVTDVGSCEHAALPSTRYKAYADCAGGTGSDSFAFAIAHRSGNVAVLDVLREFKPRFIPAQVIDSLAQLCKAYNGIHEVQGDKYAVGFHQAEWRTHGIRFVACDRSTSENYLALLPLLLAGRARLLDNKTLRGQLSALERRV